MFRARRLSFMFILIVSGAFIWGCAPSTLPKDDLNRLCQSQKITAVHYPPRLTFAFFPEEGLKGEAIGRYFGPIGLISGGLSDLKGAQELGGKFVVSYGLEDPVIPVKLKTIALLQKDGRIPHIRTFDAMMPDEDAEQLQKTVAGEYALVFKTYTWMLSHYSKYPGHYIEAYRAQSQLVRLTDGKVLWSGECRTKQRDVKKALTLIELTADQGALVKSIFQEHADACAEELAAQILGTAP